MTQEHPITPPPALVEQWYDAIDNSSTSWKQELAIQAARWGADQELEACCEAIDAATVIPRDSIEWLRAARRPKPASLKEQALSALYAITSGADDIREFYQDIETIKAALEAMPD